MVTADEDAAGRRILETFIAANPRNKNNLIATAISPQGDEPYSVFYHSFDGGKSWKRTFLTDLSGKLSDKFHGADPLVAFNKAGTAFFLNCARRIGNGNTVHVSHDGGKTAGLPQRVALPTIDHPMPAADIGNGPYAGSVYVFGPPFDISTSKGSRLELFKTRSNGQDWTRLEMVNGLSSGLARPDLPFKDVRLNSANNGIIISRPGKLFFFARSWDRDGSNTYYSLISSDGGETFSKPKPLVDANGKELIRFEMGSEKSSIIWPGLAIDSSGGRFNDRLYLVWMDRPDPDGKWLLSISRSDDHGETWTNRRIPAEWSNVSTLEGDLPRASHPALSVNDRGVLLLTFYAFRPTSDFSQPDADGYRQRSVTHQRYVTASIDGGETFLPAVPIASVPTKFVRRSKTIPATETSIRVDLEDNVTRGRSGEGLVGLQDYLNQAVGSDGRFHTQWMDSRTGLQQMWYAPVDVVCPRNVRSKKK